MKSELLLCLGVLAGTGAAACEVAPRNNPHDPANKPEIHFTLYRIDYDASGADADLFLGEYPFRAEPGSSGTVFDMFLVDAQLTKPASGRGYNLEFQFYRALEVYADDPGDPNTPVYDPCGDDAYEAGLQFTASDELGATYPSDDENYDPADGDGQDPQFGSPCPNVPPFADGDGDGLDDYEIDTPACRLFQVRNDTTGEPREQWAGDPNADPPVPEPPLERIAPLCLRVRQGDSDYYADAWIPFYLTNVKPDADAGPDLILPRLDSGTHAIELDGKLSEDRDRGDPLCLCWQQVEYDGLDGVVNAACRTDLISAVDSDVNCAVGGEECPLPSALSDTFLSDCAPVQARAISFDAPGTPVRYRFRLFARDAFGWGAPDEVQVVIGEAPLWTLDAAPASATRWSGGLLRSGDPPGDGAVLAGGAPGVTTSDVLVTGTAGEYQLYRLDHATDILTVLGPGGPTGAVDAVPTAAERDAAGVVWFALQTQSPAGVFVGVADGNGMELATGFFAGHERIDLLAPSADGAWAVRRGGTSVTLLEVSGTAVVEGAPLSPAPPFRSVQGLAAKPDGTAIVSDAQPPGLPPATDGLGNVVGDGELRECLGNGCASNLPGPFEPEDPTYRWFRPMAVRYEDPGTPLDPADDLILVGDSYVGLLYFYVVDGRWYGVSQQDGDARHLRLDYAGGLIWALDGSPRAISQDAFTTTLAGRFDLDGLCTGAGAVAADGSLRLTDASSDRVLRLPTRTAGPVAAIAPRVGQLRDASTEPTSGGVWVAYSDPPQIVAATADGGLRAESRLCGMASPLQQPGRIALDPASTRIWAIDELPGTSSATWLLFNRDADENGFYTDDTLTTCKTTSPVVSEEVLSVVPVRLRAAGLDAASLPQAWAMTAVSGTSASLVHVRANGSAFDVPSLFPLRAAAGPAVSSAGTAWIAQCQPAATPQDGFDPFAPCDCAVPNLEVTCSVGLRLATATPGGGLVAWGPPAVSLNLGTCLPGELCGVLPLDIAYDRGRDALWIAGLDHGASADRDRLRVWHIDCASAGPLEACPDADVDVHGPDVGDLEAAFELGQDARIDFYGSHSDVLGVDPGTGEAWLLDPEAGLVHRFRDDPGTQSVRHAGTLAAPGADRIAIGR